jgi:hypothetical protein
MLRISDILMTMRICYYDLVDANSKTFVLYLLINFTLFSLYSLFSIPNHSTFRTRSRFNWFRHDCSS